MLSYPEDYKTVERSYSVASTSMNLNYLKTAIDSYTHEINTGKLDSCIAWSNRGLCKLNLGIANKDKESIHSAMEDFNVALVQCEEPNEAFELAQNYLALAHQALATIFG
jgi:hypothetical protein